MSFLIHFKRTNAAVIDYFKKNRNYYFLYLILLIVIYSKFLIFYHFIDNPIHSPFRVIGPVIFTLLNSILFSLPFFAFKKLNVSILIYLLIIDILLIVNTAYFHYFGNVIPFFSYGNISNMVELKSTITSYFEIKDFIYLIPSIVFFMFYYLVVLKPKQVVAINQRKIPVAALLIIVFMFIGLNTLQDKIYHTTFKEKFYNIDNNQPNFVSYYGILPLWIYQIYIHLYLDHAPLSSQERHEIEKFVSQQTTNFKKTSTSITEKNIILILVESLDSWLLSYENGKATPFLNSLKNDSSTIFIRNVLPQINHGRSADAQLIIHTGLLPVFNNSVANLYAKQYYPSIAEAIAKTHNSLTIMGNSATFWNQKTMNLSYHIDSLLSIESLKKDELIGMGISDESVFKQSANILSKTKKPFYCQIVTLSSHDGIEFKDAKSNLHFPANFTEDTKGYIKSIQYVDKSIKKFINLLKQKNIYENSIIIITGDHDGPYRDVISKAYPNIFNKLEISNKIAFVPFFIINSGKKFSQLPHQVMGQIDIYPTILNLLNENNYFWKGMGESLFSSTPPTFAISKKMEVIGDTATFDSNFINQKVKNWKISDVIIRKKYFNTK